MACVQFSGCPGPFLLHTVVPTLPSDSVQPLQLPRLTPILYPLLNSVTAHRHWLLTWGVLCPPPLLVCKLLVLKNSLLFISCPQCLVYDPLSVGLGCERRDSFFSSPPYPPPSRFPTLALDPAMTLRGSSDQCEDVLATAPAEVPS